MERLGLIVRVNQREIKRSVDGSMIADSNNPSQAIRFYHEQMILKAKESIEGQEVDERDLRSSTVSISLKNFPRVQEIVRLVHREILQLSSETDADEVYQFNTQFFRMTENRRSE